MRPCARYYVYTLDECLEKIQSIKEFSHLSDTNITSQLNDEEIHGKEIPFIIDCVGEEQEISDYGASTAPREIEVFWVKHYNFNVFETWVRNKFGFTCIFCNEVSKAETEYHYIGKVAPYGSTICLQCGEHAHKSLKEKYKGRLIPLLEADKVGMIALRAVTNQIRRRLQ